MTGNIITMPKKTLLKYNNPVVVNTTITKHGNNNSRNEKQAPSSTPPTSVKIVQNFPRSKNFVNAPHKISSSAHDTGFTTSCKATTAQEILNSMFPPQTWSKDDQEWTRCISSTPATRSEVCKLTEDLDLALKDQKANMFGICHVREELFSDCFDELIRQVTISCTERGALLLRIRDDINMTIDAYRNLYESSVTFGIRKALMARQEKEKLQSHLQSAQDENKILHSQVEDLKDQFVHEREEREKQRMIENEKNETEIKRLKDRNKQIKEALERFLVEGQIELAKTVMSDPKYIHQ